MFCNACICSKSLYLTCRGNAETTMSNWLTAVGFWEQQMLRRILTSWKALGGQKLLTALAHWESLQSGLGPAFRWWRHVVLHLRNADHVAQQHRQQHACRAVFQASPLLIKCASAQMCVSHGHSCTCEHDSACHLSSTTSVNLVLPETKSLSLPWPPVWCLSGSGMQHLLNSPFCRLSLHTQCHILPCIAQLLATCTDQTKQFSDLLN